MAFAQALAARDLKAKRLEQELEKKQQEIMKLKSQIKELSAMLTPQQVKKAEGLVENNSGFYQIAMQRASVRLARVLNGVAKHELAMAIDTMREGLARKRANDIAGFQIKQQNMEMLRLGGISLHAWKTYVANMTARCLERSVAAWALHWRHDKAASKIQAERRLLEQSAAEARAAAEEARRLQQAIEDAERRRRLLQRLAKEAAEMYTLDRAVTATLRARLAAGFERFVSAIEDDRDWDELLRKAAGSIQHIKAAYGFNKWMWVAMTRKQALASLRECQSLLKRLQHGKLVRCLDHWHACGERRIRGRNALATMQRFQGVRGLADGMRYWQQRFESHLRRHAQERKAQRLFDRKAQTKRWRHWRKVNASITVHKSPEMLIENQRLFNLGICYQRGEGVGRDMAKAIECFEQAARRGFQPAQFNLGMIFFKGDGVQRDIAKGMEYLTDAGVFAAIGKAHRPHPAEERAPAQSTVPPRVR